MADGRRKRKLICSQIRTRSIILKRSTARHVTVLPPLPRHNKTHTDPATGMTALKQYKNSATSSTSSYDVRKTNFRFCPRNCSSRRFMWELERRGREPGDAAQNSALAFRPLTAASQIGARSTALLLQFVKYTRQL